MDGSNNDCPILDDEQELLRHGVLRVPLPPRLDRDFWSKELSQVTPMIMAGEGDGEYAFYRNILEEPDFPFDLIFEHCLSHFRTYFGVEAETDVTLDDAFCVHYNMTQHDTSGAKHTDPSDITANLCLFTSSDFDGSVVQFYGTQELAAGVARDNETMTKKVEEEKFGVRQLPGFATLHWGHHPHETTVLRAGERTNIILTYCFSDPKRSGAARRSCYFT